MAKKNGTVMKCDVLGLELFSSPLSSHSHLIDQNQKTFIPLCSLLYIIQQGNKVATLFGQFIRIGYIFPNNNWKAA